MLPPHYSNIRSLTRQSRRMTVHLLPNPSHALNIHTIMARPRAKKVPPPTRRDSPSPPSSPPLLHPILGSSEFPLLSQDDTTVLSQNRLSQDDTTFLSQNWVPENDSLHASADMDSIPAVFKAKTKSRSSHIWLPENGKEILVKGSPRWQCQRCKWLSISCNCLSPLTDMVLSRPKSINRCYLCDGNYQKCARASPVETSYRSGRNHHCRSRVGASDND